LNTGQFIFSLWLLFQFQLKESLTQLILEQKIPTSKVDQQAVAQKFVTNITDLILGCGGRRSWENWQSVTVVICKLFQQVTRLF